MARASELTGNFDKTKKGYIAWCAQNGYAPSSDDSVMAYLLAQTNASMGAV